MIFKKLKIPFSIYNFINTRLKEYYRKKYIPVNRNCEVCKRDIRSVSSRRKVYKYCSTKCLLIAQGMRDNGQTTMMIEIPIKDYYKIFQEKKDGS